MHHIPRPLNRAAVVHRKHRDASSSIFIELVGMRYSFQIAGEQRHQGKIEALHPCRKFAVLNFPEIGDVWKRIDSLLFFPPRSLIGRTEKHNLALRPSTGRSGKKGGIQPVHRPGISENRPLKPLEQCRRFMTGGRKMAKLDTVAKLNHAHAGRHLESACQFAAHTEDQINLRKIAVKIIFQPLRVIRKGKMIIICIIKTETARKESRNPAPVDIAQADNPLGGAKSQNGYPEEHQHYPRQGKKRTQQRHIKQATDPEGNTLQKRYADNPYPPPFDRQPVVAATKSEWLYEKNAPVFGETAQQTLLPG